MRLNTSASSLGARRHWLAWLILTLATGLTVTSQVTRISTGRSVAGGNRVALVIGNASYRTSALRNAVNDASDFAAALKRLGFDVLLVTNIESKTQMDKIVRDWSETIPAGGVAVFYFSGHGAQEAGSNFLIPTRAHIAKGSDLSKQALELEHVMNLMNSPDDDHTNIIFVDACRAQLNKDIVQGLAPVVGARGTFIAYATAPGTVAVEGSGRNGLFTAHLLEHIRTPDISIEEMLRRVRRGVILDPDNKMAQLPWDASSLTAGFSFAPTELLITSHPPKGGAPRITFTAIPPQVREGDANQFVDIAGEVVGADPDNNRIVLFSQKDKYYVQPTVGNFMTRISPDGKWRQAIHPGERYIALLVPLNFVPETGTTKAPHTAAGVLTFEQFPRPQTESPDIVTEFKSKSGPKTLP